MSQMELVECNNLLSYWHTTTPLVCTKKRRQMGRDLQRDREREVVREIGSVLTDR